MDFSGAPTQQFGNNELIPKGTLAWAYLTLRPFNADQGLAETPSKAGNGNAYLDVELTIVGGPFDKRKVWDMIGVAGSEQYVQGGHAAIRHILEVGKGANDQNKAGYVIGSYFDLDGLKTAVEITIEAGTGGYPDKNRVRYLSPNPQSDTHKKFQRLMNGETAAPATSAPAANPPAAWAAPTSAGTVAQEASPPAAPAPAQQPATAKPSWL